MARANIIGLSGSLTRPSRMTALVEAILDRLSGDGDVRLIELVDEAPHLVVARAAGRAGGDGRRAVECADLLIVGSPVDRASYIGALKHLFDIVDHRALQGIPVLLAATGESPSHSVVTEHQLRPLSGFFGVLTLPTAIYALDRDFERHALASAAVRERIDRSVAEARHQLRHLPPASRPTPMRHAAQA